MNKFTKKFNDWLFSDFDYRKSHNPFIEAFEELNGDLPEVKQVINNNKEKVYVRKKSIS